MPIIAGRTIGLIDIHGDLPPCLFEIEERETRQSTGNAGADDVQWERTSVVQADLKRLRADLRAEAETFKKRVDQIRSLARRI
jgi:hypothetical protein